MPGTGAPVAGSVLYVPAGTKNDAIQTSSRTAARTVKAVGNLNFFASGASGLVCSALKIDPLEMVAPESYPKAGGRGHARSPDRHTFVAGRRKTASSTTETTPIATIAMKRPRVVPEGVDGEKDEHDRDHADGEQ